MKQFFQNLGYRIQSWMQGRYGTDEMNRFLYRFAFVFLILSLIFKLNVLYYISLFILIYCCIRSFSRDFSKRQKERAFYLKYKNVVSSFFSLQKKRWDDRKTHAYFKCPSCKKVLRVPKGKGKIRITCPGCGCTIDKNT